MPTLPVSLDGDATRIRTVEYLAQELMRGVLCEVLANEGEWLCVVESINADGSIVARRLPAAPRQGRPEDH